MQSVFDPITLNRLTSGQLRKLLATIEREGAALPQGSRSHQISFENARRIKLALRRKAQFAFQP